MSRDVEVLLADQIQQQVERAFRRPPGDLERIGRDVEVLRQREQRLAVQAREGHLVDRSARIGLQAIRWSTVQDGGVSLIQGPRRGSAQRGSVW